MATGNPFPGNRGISLVGGTPGPAPKRAPVLAKPSMPTGQFKVGMGEGSFPNVGLVAAVPYTHGLHDLPAAGVAATPRPAAKPAATNVQSMQKFLASKGYQIPVDGMNGPLTQAAAADFRGSRNPQAFNVGHGLVHDSTPGATVAPVTPTAQPVAPAAPGAPAAKPPAKTPARQPETAAAPAPTRPAAAAQPTLADQAKSIVDAIVAAETKRITDAENARSTAGTQAIQGYTQAQQDLLKSYSPLAAAAYGGAEQGQNAIDAALAQKLSGSGSQLGQELGAKLAAIAADPQTAARVSGDLAQTAQGASNAEYAKGSASLSSLNSQGAAAKTYAGGLPGVASLQGMQSLRGLQGSISSDQANQLGTVQSQVPALTQNALGTLTTAKSQADANKLTAIFAAGYDPKTGMLNPAARKALAGLYPGLSPAALAGAPKGTVTKPVKTAAMPRVSATLSKAYGQQVDVYGNPVLDANGKPVPYPTGPGKTGKTPAPLSQADQLKYKGKAATIAEQAYNGFQTTDKNGVTTDHPPLNYQQALHEAGKEGVPLTIAQAALNSVYKPGERSRPWLTFQQRQALLKAGAPVGLVNKAITNQAAAVALVKQFGGR